MIRYTARHGTTFQLDSSQNGNLQIISAADDRPDGMPLMVDFEDLREFMDNLKHPITAPQDSDCAAVGSD